MLIIRKTYYVSDPSLKYPMNKREATIIVLKFQRTDIQRCALLEYKDMDNFCDHQIFSYLFSNHHNVIFKEQFSSADRIRTCIYPVNSKSNPILPYKYGASTQFRHSTVFKRMFYSA